MPTPTNRSAFEVPSYNRAMRVGFLRLMWGLFCLGLFWFGLLIAVCLMRRPSGTPFWTAWFGWPGGSIWNLLLVAPAGVAAGGLVGFAMASYGRERKQIGEWVKTLSAMAGGASAADLLRGPSSYLVQGLRSVSSVCGGGTSPGLVFLILLAFFGMGFLSIYAVKMAFLNPLALIASPGLLNPEDEAKADAEGVGGKPGAETKALAESTTGILGSATRALSGVIGKASSAPTTEKARATAQVEHSDDPQKGKWGGSPVRGGFALLATVTAAEESEAYFRVRLWVRAVDPEKTLSGRVVFHLHNTFREPEVPVTPVNGIATLERLAWGAFTVGAELPNGVTLELDLSQLPDAPKKFRER